MRTTSAWRASELPSVAVIEIRGMSKRRAYSTMLRSSVVSPGPGKREDHVVAHDHAEIAMARFGGMDEEGGRPGRGEGGGDLAADMTALADAGDDDPPGGGAECRDGFGKGLGEAVVERLGEGDEAGALGLDGPPRGGRGARAGPSPVEVAFPKTLRPRLNHPHGWLRGMSSRFRPRREPRSDAQSCRGSIRQRC